MWMALGEILSQMNPCAKDSNRKSFTRQVSSHLSQAPSLMIVTIGICGEHVEAMLTTGQNEHGSLSY